MTRIVVLGGGMIGATMAMDLAAMDGVSVTVVDARADVLEGLKARYGVDTAQADLGSAAAVSAAVASFDVCVGALPSVIGLQTLRAVIDAGVHFVDISFMPEDPRQLSEAAAKAGVIAVVDCGVAPGISNMLAGYGATALDRCERIAIYVGGLPHVRRWPYEYKAPFAPFDVVEEYTRPSRIVEHGHVVVREALSEPELVDFDGIGTLEAFNTDGLRTLIDTLDVPNMVEKTMRYPGHIELMRVFRDLGLFSGDAVQVGEQLVVPRDVTAALLFPKWQFEPGEGDLIAMQVCADGVRHGEPTRLKWQLRDDYDPASDTRAMSRCTAFPATIVAGMIARGQFPLGPGVYPPEVPAREAGFLDTVLAELDKRGVRCKATVEPLPS